MRRRRIILAVAFFAVVVAWPPGSWVRNARPWETAERLAERVCGEYDVSVTEASALIRGWRSASATREQAIEEFFGMFTILGDAGACLPCAEAVLDVSAG